MTVRREHRDMWWLATTWLRHRNPLEAVHPLLVCLQEARGTAFMTCGHVLEALDAMDPEAVVRAWIGGTAPTPSARRRPLGLPDRTCAWVEVGVPCGRLVRAVKAKFCEAHAAASTRASKRAWKRARCRKSSPLLALAK